jgi:hypothetical protein
LTLPPSNIAPGSEPTEPPSPNRPHNLPLFAWLWAAFTLFDRGHEIAWARTPLEGAELAAAVAVLVGPTRIWRFLTLTVLQTANLWWWMPGLVNHTLFALLVDMTVIAAALLHLITRRGRFEPAAFYASFAPAVRIGLLLLYVFAALPKFNTAFLDLSDSCAVDHYVRLGARLAAVGLPLPSGDIPAMATIAGTLVIESAIPLLLAFAGTRIVGIVVTLLFHYALALNGFYDFSAMAYALLLLFTPNDFSAVLLRQWQTSRLYAVIVNLRDPAGGGTHTIPLSLVLVSSVVLLLVLEGNRWQRIFGLVYMVWLAYGAFVIIVGIRGLIDMRRMQLRPLVRPYRGPAVLLALPVLVTLNGMCPYIGLKTETSFTMFSNLRTEEGFANHLFLPSLHIFPFQWDLVRVESSSDRWLKNLAARGDIVPFYVLRDHISRLAEREQRDISVTFVRNGVRYKVERAERDRRLSRPYPFLLRKVMLFRPISRNPGRCLH